MQNWKKHIFGLKDVVIFSLFSLLLGLTAGFFLSPVKRGMIIGSNNGNRYISKDEADKDFHEDLEMDYSMNSEITMSVSSMTRTRDSKAVYVLFQDGQKSAEISLPECKLISNKGFSDEEISQLSDYVQNEQDGIYDMAKTVNPMKAFLGK